MLRGKETAIQDITMFIASKWPLKKNSVKLHARKTPDWRVAKQTIVTFAENSNFDQVKKLLALTPLPFRGGPVLRTTVDEFKINGSKEEFLKQESRKKFVAEAKQDPLARGTPLQNSISDDLSFIDHTRQYWKDGVNVTRPKTVIDTILSLYEDENVSVEDITDLFAVKNLNAPSDKPEDNVELHKALARSIIKTMAYFFAHRLSTRTKTELFIYSHDLNPKLPAELLYAALAGFRYITPVSKSTVPVLSFNNAESASKKHTTTQHRFSIELSPTEILAAVLAEPHMYPPECRKAVFELLQWRGIPRWVFINFNPCIDVKTNAIVPVDKKTAVMIFRDDKSDPDSKRE
jgi:hypothetical protein